MILHLERKFTAPTETYIANQINFQHKYKSIVFTTKSLNNLTVDADIFEVSNSVYRNLLTKKQISRFSDLVKENKPALIHGHFLTDSAFFHPFSKQLSIPKICSAYGYDVSNFPKKYFGLGEMYFRSIFNEYDAFLAMSNDMADDMKELGCPANKIIVHYHGIDTEFFSIQRVYEQKEVFNILTVASLVPKKGHLSILKALKLLNAEQPSIKFRYNIVGKGLLLEDLMKYVNENDLNDKVSFLGLIKHGEELINLMRDADVFIHPSITDKNGGKEGIPGTIVEAMASGLPVIGTYHAGIPEVISNNDDGFLVREYDVEAIARLLSELYRDSNLRQNIGQKAKEKALKKLDIRIKTLELIDIYDSLIL